MTKRTSTQTLTTETDGENPGAISVAVVKNEIKHLNESMNRLEIKFDAAILGFVTHEKLKDVQKSNDEKHKEIDKAIGGLEDWNRWFVRIVLGLFVTGLAALVINYK